MLITAEKRIKENTHVYNASVKYGIKFLFFGKNARTGQFIFLSCHLLAYFPIRFSIGAREATEKI
jgi:hypothetical protein